MPFPFNSFFGGIPLDRGCALIMLIYLVANMVTLFTCVTVYTIGDSLFLFRPRRALTLEYLVSRTWTYYVVFLHITSCMKERLWITVAAIGITLVSFFGVLLEIPSFIIPFLIYEISSNVFFSYFKILWCAVFGVAMYAPIEFIIFLIRVYFWLILLSYCVRLYQRVH